MTATVDDQCAHRAWWERSGGPFTVLFWTPLLLIAPVNDAIDARLGWLAWLILAAVFALSVGAVLTATWPRVASRPASLAFVAALAAVTVTATVAYSTHWSSLYVTLSVALAVTLEGWAPTAIGVAALVGAATVLGHGGTWGEAGWGCALIVFLSGMGTFAFQRLFAVIAELNRTRTALAEAAVSAERVRFSRDLHDLLGHTLSVIVVKAEATRRLIPRKPDAAEQHARDIEEIGRQALQDVRDAVSGYRAESLAGELDRAGKALAAAGIEVSTCDTDPALPAAVDRLLGWVVREGTTNVIRHSGARECRIVLRHNGDRARLELTDDGVGGQPAGGGSGLVGLRERVGAMGGSLEAGPAERGFRLSVDVPVS
ncbi:sensor histidine kinase [Labedaea rhizosphaerae]|nr:histidine kinase [Labedaea rhizosphaerae]